MVPERVVVERTMGPVVVTQHNLFQDKMVVRTWPNREVLLVCPGLAMRPGPVDGTLSSSSSSILTHFFLVASCSRQQSFRGSMSTPPVTLTLTSPVSVSAETSARSTPAAAAQARQWHDAFSRTYTRHAIAMHKKMLQNLPYIPCERLISFTPSLIFFTHP